MSLKIDDWRKLIRKELIRGTLTSRLQLEQAQQQLDDAENEIMNMRCDWPDANLPPSRDLLGGGSAVADSETGKREPPRSGFQPKDQGKKKKPPKKKNSLQNCGRGQRLTRAQVCENSVAIQHIN